MASSPKWNLLLLEQEEGLPKTSLTAQHLRDFRYQNKQGRPGAGATTPTPHQPPDVTGRDSCEWPPEPTALYDADDIARIPACIREANTRKRDRAEEVNRILASALCRDDAKRLCLLLETIRIVYNNLPFRFGEYEESVILKEVVTKELIGFIRDNRLGHIKCLTMVVDFWTPKHGGEKYLGLRIYFVDSHFRLRTVLLGTRHFLPMYGERDQGIRGPFERWICGILFDFGLSPSDFFGSTTDSSPDVKWMMNEGLGLKWEWCIPHMVNAATKMGCGLTRKSHNPEMSELLSKLSQTIHDGAGTGEVASSGGMHLVQLLSILTPILLVTKRSQAQDTNQVQVLLSLYTMRMTSLALDSPIRRYDTAPTNAANVFDDDILATFAVQPIRSTERPAQQRNKHDTLIAGELKRWLEDSDGLQMITVPDPAKTSVRRPESILEFWHRQQQSKRYVLLPMVARILFAVPSSSAQIERDFGNSGQMVTALHKHG
ncbi:hypothetical protein PHYSODRAFT_323627 [Phytophthora sojae]|uniref:HAT C-terminal dimerisation domain-containing protein n=1 Tax=Phytophthora sojae (strain P6497) TaxID=1094619 RepID=G4YNC8_PHYSP|nr:hypothetical protein PHYSODRAFT_323627 [Phytophthora sojae]EGZ30221.1 hypothetical protein PHYSODRAFT_323627 [Phytophthora sojae]|eukprot:XP_009517496.1 hypothetical protein PHYSODRAFT_323627 [Phytophthora sojae]